MSINSKYAPAGREMAATSSHLYHGAAVGGARDGELYSSDYSSSEEELGMAGAEEDRRRLLQQRDEPYLAAAVPGLVHPHHVVTHVGHQGGLPPAAAGPMAAGNGQGEAQNTQYGSVSSSLPPNSRNKARWKRYRLPFLILLVFDCGLVVFLSIIAYDSKKDVDNPIPELAYFRLDLDKNFFDLVLLGILRLLLNALLYILMGWVTRTVMGLTTIISAVYVPLKAFYCWPLTSSDDGDFQDIPILLILFVSFVMPWAEAFFFEFKYLPAELARLSTVSWRRWEFWLWPRALVRSDISDPPSLPNVASQPRHTDRLLSAPPLSRHYAASTVSLDFRTPMGSTRNSPIPNHMMYGDRSCNTGPDEDLPPISEETTPPLIQRTLSAQDQHYKGQGERVLEQMLEFTANNDTWKLERTSDGVKFYSRGWEGRKMWKAEREMSVSADQLWRVLYPGDQMSLWNPQCTRNESLYKVDEETDVVYSVSSAFGPVSSRDFVSLRQISTENGCFVSATVATTFSDKPPQPGKVRGENGPCGYKVVPIDDSRCLYIWVLNTDLKGWLPQSVIDQTFCSAMSNTFQRLQEFLEQRRSEGRL